MKSTLFLFVISVLYGYSKSPIIPAPLETIEKSGFFNLNKRTEILLNQENDSLAISAQLLNEFLNKSCGFYLDVEKNLADKNQCIRLRKIDDKSLGKEGYILSVDKNIEISANDFQGLFYGIQSLRQIINAGEKKGDAISINKCYIRDIPRFSYRGMHLDVSRHFFDKKSIMKFLSNMALHKLNTFHWHLTDDQGWRIEIKAYPELVKTGAWRSKTMTNHYDEKYLKYNGKSHGGYYTQKDIKEIVAYAAERYITIIPEIEMPGHAQAAIASYPWLGCLDTVVSVRTEWGISPFIFNLSDTTFRFLEKVLDEVMELFPSQYIHIGGDEVITKQWEISPSVQAKKNILGFTNERRLQTWFVTQIDNYLKLKGRKTIGWDEVLNSKLSSDVTIMVWRKENIAQLALERGHKVIMSPQNYCYFDFYQAYPPDEPMAIGGYIPLELAYAFNPAPDKQYEHMILGGQANVWTEYIPDNNHLEYMVFPRIAATSESLWTIPSNKNLLDFYKRLEQLKKLYEVLDIKYCKKTPCSDK